MNFRSDPLRRSRDLLARWVHRHKALALTVAVAALLGAGGLVWTQWSYARLVEARLGSGSLRTNSSIYAAPRLLGRGDVATPDEIIAALQRAGYTGSAGNQLGWYRRAGDVVEITSGPESYFEQHAVALEFSGGRLARIVSRTDNREVDRYAMEPELITNVLDEGRGKRRPVLFSEFPKHLVEAVVSVEDKRFFEHSGLDFIRIAGAAYVDLKEGRKEQGASTLTMQLARSFWLDQDKNWSRKFSEVFIAAELERRFSKEEIFQLYANEVYLGRSGSFSVHGFGEAARAYFGKDVRDLSVAESAMLAGMIQRPSHYNPFRFPDRVKQRRNLVLTLMHHNGFLDAPQLAAAMAAPVKLQPAEIESSEAPYFVDLVNDDLQDRFEDWDFAQTAFRIYSTLDLDLQRIAVESIASAMAQVDKAARRAGGKKVEGKTPQVALVALDPHTGAIKALVGGRNYGRSQLNRVLAKRPPGSTFKPFVYAAGLELAAANKPGITAATVLMDEPTRFMFNNQPYEPANFGDQYYGPVSARQALTRSLNIPTIKIAERTGFDNVVRIAKAAGITQPLGLTPSLALGAYEVPPIALAEAYTIFSNGGVHVKRHWIESIRNGRNETVYQGKPEENRVLDARVAYLMTNLMEDVMRYGTAAAVRSKGFQEPAAGKTGTAHDGWFAGFTNHLLAVVWVGYDDYTELNLEGSKSALPVWAEFMKRAHALKQYAKPKPFTPPEGLVRVNVDAETGLVAGEECFHIRTEMFVAGTQPKERCSGDHYFDGSGVLTDASATQRPAGPRKSVFGRVLDVFR